MVIPLDPDVIAALEQSHEVGLLVQSFYGDTQTIPSAAYPQLTGVPVTSDGSITFDGAAQIQANGSVYVARDGGASLVPKEKEDPLAPFGQELAIFYTVNFGGEITFIPCGRFRIVEVPDMAEFFRRFPGLDRIVGYAAQLTVADRFDQVIADDFLVVTAPTPGNSTWDEIQRLSPIPIVQTLGDAPLPAGLVYSGRYDAIVQLMSNLGAEPHMTRQGALTARVKDSWLTADPNTPAFTINGTMDLITPMSNNVINSVAITNPNDATILGLKEIVDPANPLCVTGPLGRRTYTKSDPLATTQAAADAEATTYRDRLSQRNAETATFTCLPRPDIELGDCGWIVDEVKRRKVFGEIKSMVLSLDPTQPMTGTLAVALVKDISL